MAKARIWGKSFDGSEEKKQVLAIMCPGCGTYHMLYTQPIQDHPVWKWNGSLDKPTFNPSLLIRTGKYVSGHENFDDEGFPSLSSICHSFITDGKIQFLGDCTHDLKGQTVELPEIQDQ